MEDVILAIDAGLWWIWKHCCRPYIRCDNISEGCHNIFWWKKKPSFTLGYFIYMNLKKKEKILLDLRWFKPPNFDTYLTLLMIRNYSHTSWLDSVSVEHYPQWFMARLKRLSHELNKLPPLHIQERYFCVFFWTHKTLGFCKQLQWQTCKK